MNDYLKGEKIGEFDKEGKSLNPESQTTTSIEALAGVCKWLEDLRTESGRALANALNGASLEQKSQLASELDSLGMGFGLFRSIDSTEYKTAVELVQKYFNETDSTARQEIIREIEGL